MRLLSFAALLFAVVVFVVGCESMPLGHDEIGQARQVTADRVASLESLRESVHADPEASDQARSEVDQRLVQARADADRLSSLLAQYESSASESAGVSDLVSAVGSAVPIPAPFALLLSTGLGGLLTWLRLGKDARGLRQLVRAINQAKAQDAGLEAAIKGAKFKIRAALDNDVAARVDALRSTA